MITACTVEDLPPGESVRVEGDPAIAVFNADGEFYAIDDTCTHQDASLSEGWLEGCFVECPLHAAGRCAPTPLSCRTAWSTSTPAAAKRSRNPQRHSSRAAARRSRCGRTS